ncbi:ABC transporter [Fulvimarina endophytica]|uniref:ABC transporter n=1 Tax=Fulvimarina endophytica TaxID=2293836 RepID=A0A371X7N5_9HYPH|nr:ABC transporter [Fulvimarina endophytica]RFC65218.1 ABC transporter [Fulvimarina endophytica]
MKKIIIASVAAFAVASLAGCMSDGIGKGKGKGKAPVAAPAPVYEETYVTKG